MEAKPFLRFPRDPSGLPFRWIDDKGFGWKIEKNLLTLLQLPLFKILFDDIGNHFFSIHIDHQPDGSPKKVTTSILPGTRFEGSKELRDSRDLKPLSFQAGRPGRPLLWTRNPSGKFEFSFSVWTRSCVRNPLKKFDVQQSPPQNWKRDIYRCRWPPHLTESTCLHHHHLVRNGEGFLLVMGYIDHRLFKFLLETFNLCAETDTNFRIQCTEGLI